MKTKILLSAIGFGFLINVYAYAQNGMALALDGISGYMSVPDHNDLDIDAGESFSLTLWMKSTAVDDFYRIVNKRALSGINPGYEMIVQQGTGALGMNLRSDQNVNAGPPFGTTVVTDGNWHHLVMVVDANGGTASIYVDGTMEQTSTSPAIGTQSFANDLAFFLGSNNNQSLLMNVTLDNVRVWQTALTAAEIMTDMSSVVTGNEPFLLAAWDFESVSGTFVPDLTGVHNGTLYGNAIVVPVDFPMSYLQSSVIATSVPAGRGESNERIIAVNIETEGNLNPLSCTQIKFNLEGTTNLADLEAIKIWYTGGNPRLVTTTLFGTADVGAGSIVVTGMQPLNEGSNFFWVTADLGGEAGEGNFIKGEIESVMVGGNEFVVVPGATGDQRLIMLEHRLLFSGGDYGSVNFRIPAIKTALDGSLVVAVDARIDTPGDLPNNIDIMVRRSTDMGHTWSEAITIADFGDFGASDPALVVNRVNGDLLCMFASHQGLFQSTPSNRIRFQVCRSEDNGITWSSPQEFTDLIYAPGWYAAWLASGSAHQMRNGNIIGAVGVRQNSGNVISNFMIYSNDGGQSWDYKPAVASSVGNEAKIVELDNGDLMMNIRNQSPHCRKIVISGDGGDTWGSPYYQYELIDPFVNGDLIRYTSVLDGYDKSRLLFSIASHPTIRKNLTIFLSYDEGASWEVSKVVNPGPAGYSALTILSDGTIGCFYENGEYEEYQLYFARLSLEWLTDGNDTFTFPVGTNNLNYTDQRIEINPNPTGDDIEIVIILKEKSSVKATITNETGQELMTVMQDSLPQGTHRRRIDMSELASGVYFMRSYINGITSVNKIMVSR